MSNIIKAFKSAFKKKQERNWDVIYVLVDIHDTILKGTYSSEETYNYIGMAKKCLQYMSVMQDIKLILWSSIYSDSAIKYYRKFREDGILFDYFNVNYEEENTDLACFDKKMYFSVGIDDKFGFEPETDWEELFDYLRERENESV